MFQLHKRSNRGVYKLVGEFLTTTTYSEQDSKDLSVLIDAFCECVHSNSLHRVWISQDFNPFRVGNLIAYDPDHDDFCEVDGWDYSLLNTFVFPFHAD
jgi:hypothetical protein